MKKGSANIRKEQFCMTHVCLMVFAKLKKICSNLIGCKLEIGNDGLLINQECLQSELAKIFAVGQSPTNPTPQLMPSMKPSISHTQKLNNLCNECEKKYSLNL